MQWLTLIQPIAFAFGFFAFSALFALSVKESFRREITARDRVYWAVFFASSGWFALNLVRTLRASPPDFVLLLALAFLFPALLMHLFALDRDAASIRIGSWRRWVYACYAVSGTLAAFTLGVRFGLIEVNRPEFVLGSLLVGLIGVASGFCLAALGRHGRRPWNLVLFAAVIALVIAGTFTSNGYLNMAMRSLPLLFLFVDTYYRRRLAFFDIFVKWGSYFLVTLLVLAAYFAMAAGWNLTSPWTQALLMLPVAFAIPHVCRRIGAWLDRAWFGRRYAPLDAGKLFLASLQNASTEAELCELGESALAAVFRAPCRIELGVKAGGGGTRVPIESRGAAIGSILFGERLHATPFFSEDLRLASTLAAIFAFILEHVRLQARKQALAIEAGRAELKALRAQVNPHFLFNALNAIAGLVHRDPARAEETVEKLADVFRYTLQRSDSEWVRLEDELHFVRSYLDVEQARFGDSLEVRMEIAADARDVKVPAMMVQTLVENAIKHGVAGVRGVGRIGIRAGRSDGFLRISVSDNGADYAPDRAGNGYGLRNVRERLAGYFGGAAAFTLTRDENAGLTVASIQIPADAAV